MAKAGLKKNELPEVSTMDTASKTTSSPMTGMQAKDLSVEKRVELFQAAFEVFKKESADSFGLTLDVEILATPKAIVPRMVLVDLLKQNAAQAPNQNQGQASK